jgi:hypothetical protein
MQVNEIVSGGLTANEWFGWVGQMATIGWLILVFFPRRIKPLFFIAQYAIPFSFGLIYAGLALSNYFISDGGYNSLSGVRTLFNNDFMLLAGWVHYLAFDLFIGAWIAQQADKLGMSRLMQGPILIATFMFGPVGLILFFGMRLGFLKNSIAGKPQKVSKHSTQTDQNITAGALTSRRATVQADMIQKELHHA